MRASTTQLAVCTSDWAVPAPDIRSMASIVAGSSFRCSRRTWSRPSPRTSRYSWYTTPQLRPKVVATAAPMTPSSGKGPTPKMSMGARTMLMALASHSTRMEMAASPAPRKMALMRKSNSTLPMPPSITCV
jgi:hypothetical protein